jgi:uncharacterized protein (DUF2141 family)
VRIPTLAFLFFLVQLLSAQTADLKVVVAQIKEPEGNIRIGIFDNAIDFKNKENPVAAKEVAINGKEISCVFLNLKIKRYAIAVFHDQNSDAVLNTKKLGIPLEGVGFSSKTASKLHQPIFPEASFVLKNDTTVLINLYYTSEKGD